MAVTETRGARRAARAPFALQAAGRALSRLSTCAIVPEHVIRGAAAPVARERRQHAGDIAGVLAVGHARRRVERRAWRRRPRRACEQPVDQHARPAASEGSARSTSERYAEFDRPNTL